MKISVIVMILSLLGGLQVSKMIVSAAASDRNAPMFSIFGTYNPLELIGHWEISK